MKRLRTKQTQYTDTANSIILETTRSGMGGITLFSMPDILSRADEKCSMVVNDPKGELFAASKRAQGERGYIVEVESDMV